MPSAQRLLRRWPTLPKQTGLNFTACHDGLAYGREGDGQTSAAVFDRMRAARGIDQPSPSSPETMFL